VKGGKRLSNLTNPGEGANKTQKLSYLSSFVYVAKMQQKRGSAGFAKERLIQNQLSDDAYSLKTGGGRFPRKEGGKDAISGKRVKQSGLNSGVPGPFLNV